MYSLLYRILFFVAFSIWLPVAALGQPTLSFEYTNHDFGKVLEGDKAEHAFAFTNTGDAPLVISNVKASCGCTTPDWPKNPIAPGEKGLVRAVYDSKKRPGPFNKGITVTSNASPANTLLTIKGLVVQGRRTTQGSLAKSPEALLLDETVVIKEAERDRPTRFNISLKNAGPGVLRLKNLSSTCDCVAFGRGDNFTVPPGGQKEFKLVYRPRNVGQAKETVTILTNDPAKPALKVVVRAKVVETL